MYDRMQVLKKGDYEKIHTATLEILRDVGIAFHDPEAVEIFKHHGVRVDDNIIHLEAGHIERALASAPTQFKIRGRNPDKNVTIGGEHLVLAPGYGSPFIIDADGIQRNALMADFDNFCKLVQTSAHVDMCGNLSPDPSDRPAATAHMDMVRSGLLLCDKPLLGSSVSRDAARDSLNLAAIVWGSEECLRQQPVMMGIISSLSPLQYSAEMAGALIEYARRGQVNMCGLLMQAGATGPVTLPGLLALQNAEILAGVVLTQLINPGVPVIYGTTSTITEMSTCALAIGAPELSIIQNASMQMAQFYNLPCRGSGGVTDTHFPDMQAGVESTLALTTTIMSGANFILHACGILGSYLAMSYEKFIADEEICGMLRRMLRPLEVTDARIDLPTIKEVGIGGEYLTHDQTFNHCRSEFYLPGLMSRSTYAKWADQGRPKLDELAARKVEQRLASYVRPDIDPQIEKEINVYVENHR